MVDWEQRYQDEDTPWDGGYAAPILTHLLNERPVLFQQVSRALVPGCGFGHDVLPLAEHGIQTTGFDLSKTALAGAAKLYPHKNIQWQLGDLFEDLESGSFDMVWEHTCFCAISPSLRDAYVEAIAAALKPKGFLLGLFFIETGVEEGPPYKASIEEIKEHFLTDFQLEFQMAPHVSFEGRKNREHLMLFRKLGTPQK